MSWAKSVNSYLWLEDVESDRSLGWVKQKNQQTLAEFAQDKSFQKSYKEILKIFESEKKIASPQIIGEYIYNFWRDSKNVKGLWRRQTISDFEKGKKKWETVLDLDALSKAENKNWVFRGEVCLHPFTSASQYCLIRLSDGGKDAIELREFDLKTKTFVQDGFLIPESKSRVEWKDPNTLYIATDFGPKSQTSSGYPRMIKILKRGQEVSQASTLMETQPSNMSIGAYRLYHLGQFQDVIVETLDFYNAKYFLVNEGAQSKATNKTLKVTPIQLPTSVRLYGYFKGYALLYLIKTEKINGQEFLQGSLLASQIYPDGTLGEIHEMFKPVIFGQNYSKTSFKSLRVAGERLVLHYAENLEEKLLSLQIKNDSKGQVKFIKTALNIPDVASGVSLSLIDAKEDKDEFYFTAENINLPTSLFLYDLTKNKISKLQSTPRFYKDKKIQIDKRFAKSKDGTLIPYFMVYDGKLKKDSKNKVLISGYGGFNISRRLNYSPVIGKYWLNQKNVYILANIRGGGEYGPGWHQAAILNQKQKSYEDFIAVTEDLIAKKITTPSRVAIMGGSNGGLLVGAVSMQRPDLYGAVISLVPLLDMQRYHKLLAGASWMSEYGDPDKARDWNVIQKYSPYHNIAKDKKYPHFLFYTSTKDDRVHPGHARKMVARMKEFDIPSVYLYENIEGGHGGSSNLKEAAHQWALIFEFLQKGLN